MLECQCQKCGGPYRFDTSLPSPVWNRVIRGYDLPDTLCVSCILEAFVNAGVGFQATLSGCGLDGAVIEVTVNGKGGNEVTLLENENARLRSFIQSIIGKCQNTLDEVTKPIRRTIP